MSGSVSRCSVCGRPTPQAQERYRLELKRMWVGPDALGDPAPKSKCETAEVLCPHCGRRMRKVLSAVVENMSGR